MGKIKNWKKMYEDHWRNRKTGDMVVIRNPRGKYKVTTDEYNRLLHRYKEVSPVEFTAISRARKEAVEYMKAHPNGKLRELI